MSRNVSATITVRRLSFPFPDDLDPVVIAGQPEKSFVLVGLSLLLPYLEPYLIPRCPRGSWSWRTAAELASQTTPAPV